MDKKKQMSGHSNSPYTRCLAGYVTLINMYLITSPSNSWNIINDRASPAASICISHLSSCLFFIYPYFSSTSLCPTHSSPSFTHQDLNFYTRVVFGNTLIVAFHFSPFGSSSPISPSVSLPVPTC